MEKKEEPSEREEIHAGTQMSDHATRMLVFAAHRAVAAEIDAARRRVVVRGNAEPPRTAEEWRMAERVSQDFVHRDTQ